jgi:hypothetical protein
MKRWHVVACLVFIAAGIALVAAGAGAFAFLPVLGCAAMMGAMVWMMVRSRGSGGGPS